MTCTKHAERFLDWEDHSKPIVCAICEIHRLRAMLGVTVDGQLYGKGSKVFYRDLTGCIQGLDVRLAFATDASVPEIVFCPRMVYSTAEAAREAEQAGGDSDGK